MADQANIFDATGTTTVIVTDPIVTADPFADKLKTIVGPDGKPKYANTQMALDALFASQAHIVTLEAEKAQERAEIERLREVERNARSLEEIAERLKNTNTPDPRTVTPSSGVDENTVNTLVVKALEARDRQSLAQANFKRVNDTLTEKFKDKAPEVVSAKALELGMSPKELGELSSRNPQLVLSLFGSATPASPSPTTTSIHYPSSPPAIDEVKRPEKSLISGTYATVKNQKELMAQIREQVYKKLDVTT